MIIKNSKGITLIELIMSIALISVVVLFLFRLIVDVRYNDNSIDFNRKNQQIRAMIVKTIQQDFLAKKLVRITDRTSNSEVFKIDFGYGDGTIAQLVIGMENNRQYVSYQNNQGIEKWWVEQENQNSKYNIHCISYQTSLYLGLTGEFFYMKLVIPMVVQKNSKNYIDDLELFYIGEKKDITITNFPNRSNLGNYQANSC